MAELTALEKHLILESTRERLAMEAKERAKKQGELRAAGTDLNAVINGYMSRYEQIMQRDDMLPGPKARAIKALKEEYLETFNQTVDNIQAQLDGNYRSAYARANPVVPKDVVNSPYKDEIISRLEQGDDAAEMYRDFKLRGHEEGVQVLRYYGPQHARGTNNEKLVEALNRDFPERVEAQQQLKNAEAEGLKTGQAVALLANSFSQRLSTNEGIED